DMGAFTSSITAEVTAGEKPFAVAGTLFGNNMPRLIRLADFRLEAYLDGIMLVFTHNDVPGIIGAVGTIFGSHRVNIAQMSVGRTTPGGGAIGVLNLDGHPPAAALDEVRTHPAISSARILELPAAGNLPVWLRW
ncbi:MAG: ACT domain-containing protein, partial [Pirellulaceae bacterium]|nr:ACT domain-containing protein [Pirellulaceae bacterium]